MFHFLRGLSAVNLDDLWLREALPLPFLKSIFLTSLFGYDNFNITSDVIPNWLHTCRAVEVDIDLPEENFLCRFITLFLRGCFDPEDEDMSISRLETLYNHVPYYFSDSNHFINNSYYLTVRIFDCIVTQAPGYESLKMSRDIPVAFSASELWEQIDKGWKSKSISHQPSSAHPVCYRGFYVHHRLAINLKFLEHVISVGIKRQSDCIFDCYSRLTAFDWIMSKNERRKRVVTGDTSAHQVNIGVDVSQIQKVTKRKAFSSTGED
ncbi:hypothetical protein HD806DRAFT_523803 [Xylariaceae sp. AK1471]|nr:hypothetical protein HD806DRAFT_523803 [Xylariaceae sp. AK1471]